MKKPRGRPAIDIDPKQVTAAARLSFSVGETAAYLGISSCTLHRRLKEDPAIAEAYEIGKHLEGATIKKMLWEAARAGNVKAMMFIAQNTIGWDTKATLRTEGVQRFVIEVPPELSSVDQWAETYGTDEKTVQ